MTIPNIETFQRIQSERSKEAVKNIVLSVGAKGISLITSLLLVPLTIDYVNPTRYGIWLTLSQIIGWVVFFDLGLGNGFRNRYAEAKAKGDMLLARQYLSTTYFAITCLAIVLFVFIALVNNFLNWSDLLSVENAYDSELRLVFGIVCCFFCLNMVANIFSMLLSADQKSGYSAIIICIGQLLSLLAVFLLTKLTKGSLTNLALYYSGIPCLVMLIASVIAFRFSKFKAVRPMITLIRLDLIKDILSLGVKFFVICVSMVAIFQVTNIVLSREIGPESVTQYNISYKYFNILYTLMILVITPYWSAFTDAYHKKDFEWMKKSIQSLEKVWLLSVVVGILMLAISPFFFKMWIQDKVQVPFSLSIGVLLFVLSQILANIYMYIVNGIGTVRIQLLIYLIFALVAWPLLTYSCRIFGVIGIMIIPTLTYCVQLLLSKIQIGKILNDKANGWWGK